MKFCVDPQHEGTDPLPLEEFYANPKVLADGRSNVCKTCHKRNAAIREYGYRAERREARHAGDAEGYLERHEKRRGQEALNCISEAVGEGGLGFQFNEVFEKRFTISPRWKVC